MAIGIGQHRTRDGTSSQRYVPLGEILIDREAVDEVDVAEALEVQCRSGARLGQILVSSGAANGQAVACAVAEQWKLGFADLVVDPPDPNAFDPSASELYLRHRMIPWRRIGAITTFATAEPERIEAALADLSPVHGMAFVVIAEQAQIDQALLTHCAEPLTERASNRTPDSQSVRTVRGLRMVSALILLVGIAVCAAAGSVFSAVAAMVVVLLDISTTIIRSLALMAYRRESDGPATPDGTVDLAGRRPLPSLSLLVPLYDEPQMIPTLVAALSRLDYPRELLDVRILLEEDDTATQEAVAKADMPGWMHAMVMPAGGPRTKPRALNLALDFCQGDIIGILDAEDRPAVDQLRAVARKFLTEPRDVAAVQCQLTFYNPRENWISRCFHIEYAIWFNVLLRGFQQLRLPIPLGGTSVYFRRSALEELGGWDAYNVTEDADLGMRMARNGMRCVVIESATLEEANCRALPWIRQRSRWLKGYMMTWLSHIRSPGALWRDLGPRGFIGFNILFIGGVMSFLSMPLFWISLGITMAGGDGVLHGTLGGMAQAVLAITLLVGQGVMLGCAVAALRARGALNLLGWLVLLPLYWTLGALAAWKAVIEAIVAPYYWDKTRHGVSRFAETPDV